MQEKVIIFYTYVYNRRMDVIFQKDSNSKVANNKSFKTKLVEFFKNYNSGFYYFLFLCLIGLLFFFSSLFENQFTTLFGGDYTAQQLAFYTNGYDDWWYFIKTGEFRFFDTNTYLGASNVGANSFYYLFDPFFFPILICPRAYIAQGMAILTIFKIATAGMFFRKYMKIMGASETSARITALAYAFSGWMAWFLWFNHMTEVMIVFPIMLWGVERILRDKKPWLLMFSLFLMGLTNYFFLIGMGIAAFIYAIFRFCQRLRLNSFKDNLEILGIGFIGFLAGLLLACCVAIPAALYSMDAPRAANSTYLSSIKDALKAKDLKTVFEYIFSWKKAAGDEFKHFYPLTSFVFPCASCRGTPLTAYGNEWYDNCATNTYSFIPMLLLFVPAFIRAMKDKKWSAIVATVLFVLALETPFAYYMFFGFTAPYGRWEIFFVTSYLTFTGLYIDRVKDEPIWTDIVGFVFAIVMTIGGGICANTIVTYYKSAGFVLRNEDITVGLATAIVCIAITIEFVVLLFLKKKKSYTTAMTICISLEATIMGYLTILGHWCGSFVDANNGLTYNTDIYQLNKQIEKKDKSFYRIWTYNQNEGARNDGMRNDYNGLGCFHSLYNYSIDNFVYWTRIQDWSPFGSSGCWAGSYVWKNGDIDKFLGVKYYFIQSNSMQWGWMHAGNTIAEPSDSYWYYHYNVPLDYRPTTSYKTEHYTVFYDSKNVNFATAFDNVLYYELMQDKKVQATSEDFPNSAASVLMNDELLLRGAILEQSVANEVIEENPEFTVSRVKDVRYSLSKSKLTDVRVNMFDLQQPLVGTDKYTCYTFFDPGEGSWLGNVKALPSDKLVAVNEGLFKEIETYDYNNEIYGRYVQTITKRTGGNFDEAYDPNGYSIYVPYRYTEENQADIYLIDENNKIITWDRHQDDKYQEGDMRYRGFYVRPKSYKEDGTYNEAAPRLKKIVVASRNRRAQYNSELNNIYFETYTSQQARNEKLYADEVKVTDVSIKGSKYSFKTNLTYKRFMITQLPFEKGWSLKAKIKGTDGKTTTKNLKVYSAQGGFVGFVAPVGEVSYTLSFYPANLQTGKLLSMVGALIFLSTYYGYVFLVQNKEKDKLDRAPFEFGK